MSRSAHDRFTDIVGAIQPCQDSAPHLRSADLGSMGYDAVLRDLAVIGEAVHEYSLANPDVVLDIVGRELVNPRAIRNR